MLRLCVFLVTLLITSQSIANETDYCAGYRVGFLFQYCDPNDFRCLNQRLPRCFTQHGGLDRGLKDGRRAAIQRLSFERRLIQHWVRQRQKRAKERK